MAMSDPFLPEPEGDPMRTDRERAAAVEDVPQPDVLAGPAEDEGTIAAALSSSAPAFRTPRPHDRLGAQQLRDDLADE